MTLLTRQQHLMLRLLVVPVAALVASHIVFSQVFPGQPGYQFPWVYFLTVATVMLSCWEVNLLVFRWLDTLLPFWQHPIRRLVSQVLVGGTATLLTFALVFPLTQRVYAHRWPEPITVLKGLTVCVTLASLVNGGYSGLYLINAFLTERQKNSQRTSDDQLPASASDNPYGSAPTLVSINISNGQIRLPIDQIAYFYSTGGLILLVKMDGQQVVTRYSSFAQLAPDLDDRYFFQLSRQFVVGSGAVRSVQDDINRKLVVTLVPALHKQQPHQEVTVSRYRSLELRKWLQALTEH